MGSRKRVLGRGKDRGFAAHRQGLGDPRGRRAEDWGGGSLAPQSPPPSFPFSLPKLPGSPWLPRQPLLPGAVTKETPCPPLPPSPSLACPPTPSSSGVEGGRGNGGGRTRAPTPERGAHIYTRQAPPPSLHLQPHSSIGIATAGRTPPPPPCLSPRQWRPPTQNSLGRENPHPTASPTRLGSPSGPAHCPLPPTPPIPEEALDHGPLIKRMPPIHPPRFCLPPPPGAPPRLLTARKGAPSGGQHARPMGGGPPQ